jgi:CarboxypepD_reg-like domain
MKKIFSICLFVLAIAQVAAAQTITVNGTVKDNQGNFLHFAFIQDKQFKYATYTDSVGNFTLTANSTSALAISCYGFKDTLVDVNNKTNFDLVLYPKQGEVAIEAPHENTDISKRTVLNDALSASTGEVGSRTGGGINVSGGASFPSFNPKEATEGSRYLFTSWVHGYVVNSKDSIVQNPHFFFNYDKMGGGLLLSQDKVSAIEVDRAPIKSFTLYDEHNIPRTFENMPDVDPKHYVEVLSSGKKYKIYRTLKTKFEKADFTTNGISSSGNNFDSYQDTYEYYVLNLQNNSREKLDLKKKSIKNDFANEPEKVNKYITDHSSDSIDESYLSNLGSYMNE